MRHQPNFIRPNPSSPFLPRRPISKIGPISDPVQTKPATEPNFTSQSGPGPRSGPKQFQPSPLQSSLHSSSSLQPAGSPTSHCRRVATSAVPALSRLLRPPPTSRLPCSVPVPSPPSQIHQTASPFSSATDAAAHRLPSLFLLSLAPYFLRQSLSLTLPSVSLSISIPVASSVSDPAPPFSILPSPLTTVCRPPSHGSSLIDQIPSPPPATNNHRPSLFLDFTSFSTVNAAYSLSPDRRSTAVPTDPGFTSKSTTSDLIASSSLFVVCLLFSINLSLSLSLDLTPSIPLISSSAAVQQQLQPQIYSHLSSPPSVTEFHSSQLTPRPNSSSLDRAGPESNTLSPAT